MKEVQKLNFLLWTIWKGRNVVLFQNENFNPIACIIKAKRACAEWSIRNCLSVDDYYIGCPFGPVSKNKIAQLEPPPIGRVKLNFDGSVLHTSATGGYIIRDWRGTILRARSHQYGCTSVIMAEARALRDGVQAATVAGYKDIIVEGDNQLIINALLGTISTTWQISNGLRDVRFLLQSSNNDQFQVQHIFREANMTAD